jgi:hypothetical protein
MNAPTHCPQENSTTYLHFVLLLLRLVTNPPTIRHLARLLCPSCCAPTVLPHLNLNRSSLGSDSPLRIALGSRLHPQGAVRGLVMVVFDPPQELPRYVFHRLETRLSDIVPLEVAKEGLGQTVRPRTPPGSVAGDEPHGWRVHFEPPLVIWCASELRLPNS